MMGKKTSEFVNELLTLLDKYDTELYTDGMGNIIAFGLEGEEDVNLGNCLTSGGNAKC